MKTKLTKADLNVSDVDSKLRQDIIYHRREYFIKRVKSPLMKALVWGFDRRLKSAKLNGILDKIKLFVAVWNIMQTVERYPEATRDNCFEPLTHALMNIWDEFFKYEDNPEHPEPDKHPFFGREQLFRAVKRVQLCETEHDWYYRQRELWFFTKVIELYLDGKFPELLPVMPDRRICWKEPLDKERILSYLAWRKYAGEHSKVTVQEAENDNGD